MFALVLVTELKLYGQFWLTDDRATVSPTQKKTTFIVHKMFFRVLDLLTSLFL